MGIEIVSSKILGRIRISIWFAVIPVLTLLISVPLSGRLSNAKLGNYRVFSIGCVLLFVSTVILCLVLVMEELNIHSDVLLWVHFTVGVMFWILGFCMCIVTALQLGIDQMPDASSSNISSCIAWFVCALSAGIFLSYFLSFLCIANCLRCDNSPVVALILPLCMTVILVLQFLRPKWLIIEPKSPQSLKTIYKVLKFAKQHKFPLNRSALTYWEEDIPSRIDLGKSRYGGPFTTEQVEDVKTVLRLIVVMLSFLIVSFPMLLRPNIFSEIHYQIAGFNECSTSMIFLFTYSSPLFMVLGTILCECVIYPLAGNRSPSLLRKVGFTSSVVVALSFSCLIIKLVQHVLMDYSDGAVSEWIARVLYYAMSGLLSQVLFTSVLEFFCAQSPYHMRGLVLSFALSFTIISSLIGYWLGFFLEYQVCKDQSSWCSVVPFAVKTVISLISLVLFCVVSRWYKMRVRDDGFAQQKIVEEVYDRYLTAEAARSSTLIMPNC